MLNHAPVIISISLAVLYAFGLAQHQGFLMELGLEETQFELPLHRTFFQGFVVLADWGVKGFGVLIGIALAGPMVVGWGKFAHFISGRIKEYLQRRQRRSEPARPAGSRSRKSASKTSTPSNNSDSEKDEEENQPQLKQWQTWALNAFHYIMLALGLFVIAIGALRFAAITGSEAAARIKANAGSGVLQLKEVKIKNRPNCLYGYSVVCSSSVCGYWVDSNAIVVPTSDIEWVRSLGKGTIDTKSLDKSCSLVGASPDAPAI